MGKGAMRRFRAQPSWLASHESGRNFTVPRPRPYSYRTETRPLATLRRLRTAVLLGGMAAQPLLLYQFPCQVSRDLVEIKCSVCLSLKWETFMRRLLRKIDTYHPRQEALALFPF